MLSNPGADGAVMTYSPLTGKYVQIPSIAPSGFAIRNLSVLNYAQGFTLWVYKLHGIAVDQALAPGFFAACADMLAPGDLIILSGPDGSAAIAAVTPDKGLRPLTKTE